jgi:hypothetical protein
MMGNRQILWLLFRNKISQLAFFFLYSVQSRDKS